MAKDKEQTTKKKIVFECTENDEHPKTARIKVTLESTAAAGPVFKTSRTVKVPIPAHCDDTHLKKVIEVLKEITKGDFNLFNTAYNELNDQLREQGM